MNEFTHVTTFETTVAIIGLSVIGGLLLFLLFYAIFIRPGRREAEKNRQIYEREFTNQKPKN